MDSAIEAYQRFASTYASNTSLLGLVYQKLGYAFLLKKDLDQAAKAYSSILDLPGAMNRDYALFEVARLEENRSKPDEALKHYQELMKTYPNSPLTSESAVRVKVIEAKKNAAYQADGLAGANLTARGVGNLLRYWLGQDGYQPFLETLKPEGVKP